MTTWLSSSPAASCWVQLPINGWPLPELSAAEIVIWTAAAFVVGHVVASIASLIQPWFLGRRLGAHDIKLWGLFGSAGIYDEEEERQVQAEFRTRFGDESSFSKLYDLGYTRLQQLDEDGYLQMLNTQIGFYRNMAVAMAASALATAAAWLIGQGKPYSLAAMTFIAIAAVYVWRLRRFWRRFGYAVCRGVLAIPREEFGANSD